MNVRLQQAHTNCGPTKCIHNHNYTNCCFFFYSSSACGLSKCCCRTDNALVHEIEIESVFTCDSCPENESPEVVRSHQNGTIVGAIERIR